MSSENIYDVIIVGGSYSGLAAGMALGRSLRKVLIIDSGKPCNRQTPQSHNFITQDGTPPAEIARQAKVQVALYPTVTFVDGVATTGQKTDSVFSIGTAKGEVFHAQQVLFSTGIKDLMPAVPGFAECWGISVLHCPYCHGYEVHHQKTGLIGNGEMGFHFSGMISHWTDDLTLFTDGPSTLSPDQTATLAAKNIKVEESPITKLVHEQGRLDSVILADGRAIAFPALYAHCEFEQHCTIPEMLGCEITEEGYVQVDAFQQTIIKGIYASGDCTSRMRTVASAVSMGTMAGMMMNKDMVMADFMAN